MSYMLLFLIMRMNLLTFIQMYDSVLFLIIRVIFFIYTGVTHRHLSDHLSELVENTLADLEQSKVNYDRYHMEGYFHYEAKMLN